MRRNRLKFIVQFPNKTQLQKFVPYFKLNNLLIKHFYQSQNKFKPQTPPKLIKKMADQQDYQYSAQQFLSDTNTRLRDIEEKQRIIRDRVLLIGKSLIEERESSFTEMQEMKKTIIQLKADNQRLKEFVQGITEQLEKTARKSELEILQRQLDLLRR